MLQLSDEMIGQRVLLNISGPCMNMESFQQLSERVNYLIEKNMKNIVFNLSKTQCIDSGMVNLISSTVSKVKDLGGSVELIYESKSEKDVFKMSGLYQRLLSHYKTRKEFDDRKQHFPLRVAS